MRQFAACVFGAGLLAATGAFAQSSTFGEGFYLNGYAELGYYDPPVVNGGMAHVDIDMGIRPALGTDGLSFGVSLGVDAFKTKVDSKMALYPALEMGTKIGTFSLGIPRSVYDRGVMPEPLFANAIYMGLVVGAFESSVVEYTHLFGVFNDDSIWGLRYAGVFGNTKIGASYHKINMPVNDIDAYALAISHKFSGGSRGVDFLVYGGAELMSQAGNDNTAYRIGVEGAWDKVVAGLSYSDNHDYFDARITTVYMDYKILDNLVVTGSYAHINNVGMKDLYGIGVQYDFLNNAYVKASIIDTAASSTDPYYEISLGWRF